MSGEKHMMIDVIFIYSFINSIICELLTGISNRNSTSRNGKHPHPPRLVPSNAQKKQEDN